MKLTRRRALLGLAAGAGLGAVAVGRPNHDEEDSPNAVHTETRQGGETARPRESRERPTTDRPADFPERFVQFSFDRERSLWKFTKLRHTENLKISDRGIAPDSNSLRVQFDEGEHYGTSLEYQFREADYREPTELHVRYFLRFGDDFHFHGGSGGKLPGAVGTYDRAGWGGRKVDGADGWSARMSFHASDDDADDPIQLGNYVYHAEMEGQYGDTFEWDESDAGAVRPGEWYRIDNYVRLNTPGEKDGVLKGWVNGERALAIDDLDFRHVPRLRIDRFWFTCFWGGSWTAPHDSTVYFDDLALYSERQRPDEWLETETAPGTEDETTTAERAHETTTE